MCRLPYLREQFFLADVLSFSIAYQFQENMCFKMSVLQKEVTTSIMVNVIFIHSTLMSCHIRAVHIWKYLNFVSQQLVCRKIRVTINVMVYVQLIFTFFSTLHFAMYLYKTYKKAFIKAHSITGVNSITIVFVDAKISRYK